MATETEQIAEIARVGRLSPRGIGPLFQILTARDWRTLAVVSAEEGNRAWWLVQALDQIAVQAHQPFRTLNVLEVTVARATAMAHALSPAKLRTGKGRRYLLATDSPAVNPASLGVLTACDGVLLLIQEGRTRTTGARRLVELIGRQRLIGVVLGSW
jgi:hypothetical protein